jgi:cell division protein FtsB
VPGRECVRMARARRDRRATGVHWDRVWRLAMLAVVIVLLGLYVRSGVSLWSAWRASRAGSATVLSLEAQNADLKRQRTQLHERWSTEAAARRLGMAHDGEKAYVVRGLPSN